MLCLRMAIGEYKPPLMICMNLKLTIPQLAVSRAAIRQLRPPCKHPRVPLQEEAGGGAPQADREGHEDYPKLSPTI